MVEIKHPRIESLPPRDVPSEQVSKWEKAGWLRVKPKTEPKPEKQDKQEK